MAENSSGKTRFDFATIGGLLLAAGGIVGGLVLEGGVIKDITQYTAGLIVVCGTLGAVMVHTPMHTLRGGLARFKELLVEKNNSPATVIEEILAYANKARKTGLVSLEEDSLRVEDPFLRKALTMAVDGCDLSELRSMMELQIAVEEHHAESEAKVFEAAGGYAPTIGIIGAVLGLIQVMKHLENITEVGHGIAVAFVATVYGVALANLLFLPAANKIKARIGAETERKEMILEGVVGIVEGLNPKLIRSKLEAYTSASSEGAGRRTGGGPQAVAA
ncbi:flagellar motor protein [Bryobacter aggregatus]|uniref:flagellar motor protein n=1 Tax=Bryobacter aggregatus TaxID=360054 RepID=UPI00055FF2D0|nr:flagellar motor protein [Bryobacter aggregatus]